MCLLNENIVSLFALHLSGKCSEQDMILPLRGNEGESKELRVRRDKEGTETRNSRGECVHSIKKQRGDKRRSDLKEHARRG